MKTKAHFKNHQHEQRLFQSRIIALVITIALISLFIVGRLFELQIINHHLYTTLSRDNFLNTIPIIPKRGLIYDRNGVLLAKNIPSYSLAIIPDQIKSLNATLNNLNKIIPIDANDRKEFARERIQHRPFQAVPIKDHLTPEEVARFYVNQYQFPGVVIQAKMMRKYPLGETTADVVGYVGRINSNDMSNVNPSQYTLADDIGKTGIEKYYETTLRGTIGVEEAEINASGKVVRVLKENNSRAGQDIYLTIDSQLQAIAEHALRNNSGAVVVIQPKTGEILTLATHPSYDPNQFVAGISQADYQKLLNAPEHPLYNRATRGLFAAGSTVKPFYGLAALNDGVVNTQYQIYDPGWFQLPNNQHVYHDWKYNGHGWVNLSKAITVSCDTYFYNLAVKMGIHRLDDILHTFGFGEPTGVDLTDEVSGLVPTPQWKMAYQGHPWYTGDTIVTGIGQGYLLVTPLQLATATTILANRGWLVKPHLLLKSALDQHSNDFHPEAQQVIKLPHPEEWTTVINAMQGVITSPIGTGELFGHPSYPVAAKTGTAQVYGHQRDEDRTITNIPKRLRNNHLFIAFAPVNHPQIAVAVVVEHAAEAAHVARVVMDAYFAELKTSNHHKS